MLLVNSSDLYVVPNTRGTGLGNSLLVVALERARDMGYKEVRLDTLPSMVDARRTYGRFGFQECEKYYDNPL